jgi:hypothetical protein
MRELLLCAFFVGGCMPAVVPPATPNYGEAKASADAQVDAVMIRRIEQAREMARVGGAKEAWAFGKEVENAYHTNMVSRGKVDGKALVDEAAAVFDRVAKENPSDAPQMLAGKGSLFVVAGRPDEGLAALESSLNAGPSLWPVAKLLEIYAGGGRTNAIFDTCKKVRPVVKSDEERYALLDQCAHWSKLLSPQSALAWASKDDIAFYTRMREEEEKKAAAENAAYRKKQQEDLEKLYASFSKPEDKRAPSSRSSSAGAEPASVAVRSVTIRSECRKTVRLFYGNRPRFGSGTYDTLGANTMMSHTFRVGEQMWLVDEHDDGIANTQISSSTEEIRIGSSCTSLVVR